MRSDAYPRASTRVTSSVSLRHAHNWHNDCDYFCVNDGRSMLMILKVSSKDKGVGKWYSETTR